MSQAHVVTQKTSLTVNVISNYGGTMWSALIQVLVIPVYIRLLGLESYGLIGFFVTLQAVVQVLDFGLSPAINREMARSTASGSPGQNVRDLLRTVECVYWAAGSLIGAVIAAASTLLVSRWIHVQTVEHSVAVKAVCLTGLVFAIQWPISFRAGR